MVLGISMPDDITQGLYDRLIQAEDLLIACMKEAKAYRDAVTKAETFSTTPATLSIVAKRCVNATQWIHSCYLTPYINQRLIERNAKNPDINDYTRKKETATWLNNALKIHNLTIYHPTEKTPCILLAVGSRDGYGRYVLENRETKKRSGAYCCIDDMIPIMIGILT